ncbi:MAG: hypothetical protein KJT03_12245, partial [Verrucomicrobiae bacterium]|nr:hypothetical protein [Verrucomicrobiae bacterium]
MVIQRQRLLQLSYDCLGLGIHGQIDPLIWIGGIYRIHTVSVGVPLAGYFAQSTLIGIWRARG